MKKSILLLILCALPAGLLFQCQDTDPEEAQTGYRDEARVREKLAELNSLLDSAIAFVENCRASEMYNEDQAGFVLDDEEQDSLLTLLAQMHVVKAHELAYGLTPDAGGGRSFMWWYHQLHRIDRSLWEALRYNRRPLDWLRAAKRDKEATEEILGFSSESDGEKTGEIKVD